MEKIKWKWRFDQWMEDSVWVKFTGKYQSPHFFFMLGFISGSIFLIILFYFLTNLIK